MEIDVYYNRYQIYAHKHVKTFSVWDLWVFDRLISFPTRQQCIDWLRTMKHQRKIETNKEYQKYTKDILDPRD